MVLFESLSPLKGIKLKKKATSQSFSKKPKKAVNPANRLICRFFSFIPLLNIYKITQNLCGRIVAHSDLQNQNPRKVRR